MSLRRSLSQRRLGAGTQRKHTKDMPSLYVSVRVSGKSEFSWIPAFAGMTGRMTGSVARTCNLKAEEITLALSFWPSPESGRHVQASDKAAQVMSDCLVAEADGQGREPAVSIAKRRTPTAAYLRLSYARLVSTRPRELYGCNW